MKTAFASVVPVRDCEKVIIRCSGRLVSEDEVDKEFEDFCLKHPEASQIDCRELARAIGYLLFTLEKNGLCKLVNDVVMN